MKFSSWPILSTVHGVCCIASSQGDPYMQSSPSAGNAWAQLNQNTWPAVAGGSDQAALQAQALALQLSLQASGNLDQARQLSLSSLEHADCAAATADWSVEWESGQMQSMPCGGDRGGPDGRSFYSSLRGRCLCRAWVPWRLSR